MYGGGGGGERGRGGERKWEASFSPERKSLGKGGLIFVWCGGVDRGRHGKARWLGL